MQEIMNYADLVVSRIGAMTVTEVTLLGKDIVMMSFLYQLNFLLLKIRNK